MPQKTHVLGALWMSKNGAVFHDMSGQAPPMQARPCAPLRAARRSQRQKWELAAAALEHLGLALEAGPRPAPRRHSVAARRRARR